MELRRVRMTTTAALPMKTLDPAHVSRVPGPAVDFGARQPFRQESNRRILVVNLPALESSDERLVRRHARRLGGRGARPRLRRGLSPRPRAGWARASASRKRLPAFVLDKAVG
jgi:hypothetical protein